MSERQTQGILASAFSCLDTAVDLCPPSAFRLFLNYERARVSRIGGDFTLVAWDLGSRRSVPALRAEAARMIRENARAMDLVGWLDEGSIGVLLPAARVEGANAYIRRVSDLFRDSGDPPGADAFSYPEGWESWSRAAWADGSAASTEAVEPLLRSLHRPMPAWKRARDIVGALVMLCAASPLFVLIALYIKLTSRGSVFYRQARVGQDGRMFLMLKFRTMHENTDSSAHRAYLDSLIHGDCPMKKLDDGRDLRIVPGGGLLRCTSLDELPQLINVLKGEMSLVGPRPSLPYEAAQFRLWHTLRFDVPPGMTGLWQVSGKNRLSFERMIRLDLAYARASAVGLDLRILLRTVPTVLGLAWESLHEKLGRRRALPGGRLRHA